MQKTLSIVIPVYNESVYITRCLINVAQTNIPGWKKEIIIVNDGSTDDTLSQINNFKKENSDIKIISYPQNSGKGSALRKGILQVTGDIVIIQDADLEYDPIDYIPILKEFDSGANVVYGSRIRGEKIYHNYNSSIFFYFGGIFLTKICNVIFGTNLTDQPTCYKSWRNLLSDGLLKYCSSNGFEFEIEMTAFFARTEKISEVPIHYYPRTVSHGKKIRFIDFIKSVLTVFRCKFEK